MNVLAVEANNLNSCETSNDFQYDLIAEDSKSTNIGRCAS